MPLFLYSITAVNTYIYIYAYTYVQGSSFCVYCVASDSQRINGGQYTESKVIVVEAKKLL